MEPLHGLHHDGRRGGRIVAPRRRRLCIQTGMKTAYRKRDYFSVGLVCCILLGASAATSASADPFPFDEDGVVSNARGMDLLRNNEPEKAERFFADSIKSNPEIKHYYNNLAVALMRQGEYRRAYGALKRAVELDPSYAKALSNLAIACFHLSRFREAYAYYLRARSADRKYADQRFEKTRVIRKIEDLRREAPGNDDYGRLLEHLQSRDEGLDSVRKTD